MYEDERPETVKQADIASEAVRAINHMTGFRAVPAPELYAVLGELKLGVGYRLAQALNQLAAGLERSLKEFDVYEDDGRDPAEMAGKAAGLLRAAAVSAGDISRFLELAQSAISRQGYREGGGEDAAGEAG